ncbi:MAG: FAD/NAD(P)-binding protein [Chitinophagaceae bacterium]
MNGNKAGKQIGILGGGPSGLFVYKRLVESGHSDVAITIIERKAQPGAGMPYSSEGACHEHITNVSGNEIPDLVTSLREWVQTAPPDLLKRFGIRPENFSDYKVVPRLLLGEYLAAQFDLLEQQAKKAGIATQWVFDTAVSDIVDDPAENKVTVITGSGSYRFDHIIICTGHQWPHHHEGTVPGWFDSPYPPAKLAMRTPYPVAIKGASLTAIDGIRTLARHNGHFVQQDNKLVYRTDAESNGFRLVMHSLDGLLPAIRFHLEDSHLSKEAALSEEEIKACMAANDGFVPLDYVYEQCFKEPLRRQDPDFYEAIRHMSMEAFVDHMMSLRERIDAFLLFRAEYAEAEQSIRRRESVHWKEMLAVLSFAMNYPAKHFCAEDMLRLKKVLMPLISIVIAFVPQSSCQELLALYEAGVLSLVPVDTDSEALPQPEGGALYRYTDEEGRRQSVPYKLYVDCTGQRAFEFHEVPFERLRSDGSISPAWLRFRSADAAAAAKADGNKVKQDNMGPYYLQVPGIAINDRFQVLDRYGVYNPRIYMMAVPYIAGFNPDYSGLDFCEAASARIHQSLQEVMAADNASS